MKKSFFSLVFCSLFAVSLFAQAGQFVQASIIVQRGAEAFQVATFNEAMSIAEPDDFIYLPGGKFNIEAIINERVHIYGTGWRSDSAAVVGKTEILAVTLNAGANGGSLNGVHVLGQLKNPSGQILSSYTVSRCRFANLEFGDGLSNNLILNMNSIVTGDVYFRSGTLNLSNSIVNGRLFADNSSTQNAYLNIENCFLAHLSTIRLFTYIDYISLKNSIIFQSSSTESGFWAPIPNFVFEDNLFVGNPAGLPPNLGQNNEIQDIDFRASVFENYPLQPQLGFDEGYDYHIKNDPPCGTPCNNKGIYTGPTPYQDDPENPYITAREITIGADGQSLQLNFTVNKGAN